MILSGNKIAAEVAAGNISITPFDPSQVNPASYDILLGDQVAVYKGTCYIPHFGGPHRPRNEEDGTGLLPWKTNEDIFDSKEPLEVERWTIPEKGWVLKPGIGYLMHTVERVMTEKYVPIIDGKSSIGRIFVKIHETAGYGDPGFDGQLTLEVTSQFPIRVYPGMKFGQLRFHHVDGEITSYAKRGSYTGEAADGPVPSKAWKSAFKK